MKKTPPAKHNNMQPENLDDHKTTKCIICGKEIKRYWDHHYKGIRATCNDCEINWAES